MAACEYTIKFLNSTNYKLVKTANESLEGEWTTSPPNEILPGQEVEWKSESDGIWQGTEGEISYRALRNEASSGSAPSYLPDIVVVHWNNPYVGKTDAAARVDLSPDPEPYSHGEAPQLTFGLQGNGPHDMGTDPGLGHSGWVDIIPGVLPVGPIPNIGNIAHAWHAFRLVTLPGRSIIAGEPAPSFQDFPPEVTTFAEAFDASPTAWIGSWAYTSPRTSIFAELVESPRPRFRLPHWATLFDVSVDQTVNVSGAQFKLKQTDVRETQPFVDAYDGNFDSPWFNGTFRSVLSQAGPFGPMRKRYKKISGAPTTPAGDILATIFARFALSDALELNANVTLYLYIATQHRTGSQGYAVRYVRKTADGRLVADVMLRPYVAIK